MLMARKASRKASRKGSRKGSRKLSEWQKFVKAHKGQGKTLKQLGVEYRKQKGVRKGARKVSRKASRKVSRKVSRKGRKVSRKVSRKGRKVSRKVSRKASRKVSRKGRKASRKASRKGRKVKLGKGEAYDVSCKKKCKVQKAKYTMSRKGKRTTYLLKGECPDGHKVAKIISKAEYDANK